MVRKLLVSLFLLTASCFGQDLLSPGGLRFDFGMVSGQVMTKSVVQPPYVAMTFSLYGGKYCPDACWKSDPLEPSYFHYWTGPLLSGSVPDGADFGEGGSFYLQSNSDHFGTCQIVTCTYKAKWISSKFRYEITPDGTYHYFMTGDLRGKYCDGPIGCRLDVLAHFRQDNLDSPNQFVVPGPETIVGGTLTVVFIPQ